jgi:hypothetical protein
MIGFGDAVFHSIIFVIVAVRALDTSEPIHNIGHLRWWRMVCVECCTTRNGYYDATFCEYVRCIGIRALVY